MIIIDNLQQLLNNINTGEPVLVYFSGENCSVCKVLKPKIEEEVLKQFPKFKLFEVKTDLNKEITSHFTVFSIPTTLIFFDSKEFKDLLEDNDSFAREWLGEKRYKLFKEGNYRIDKFVDPLGRQYSLAELKTLDEKTFKNLGI